MLQAMARADSVFHMRQALRVLGMRLPTFGGEPVTAGRDYAWSWDQFSVLGGAEWTDDPERGLFVYPRDRWVAMAQSNRPTPDTTRT